MRMRTRAAALAIVGVVGVGGVAPAAMGAGYGNGNGTGNRGGGGSATQVCDGTGSVGTQWGQGSAAAGQARASQGKAAKGKAAKGKAAKAKAAKGKASKARGTRAGAARGPAVPAAVPGATISGAVSDQLVFMVQEEKMARDVYALAATLYPDRVFVSIGASESTHMAAVRVLLDRYDVSDPTATLAAGTFVDEGLQSLYDTLAAQVRSSRDQAIAAGVAVETEDIADLKTALALTAPTDVTTVLGNLLTASQRHLAAFQRQA